MSPHLQFHLLQLCGLPPRHHPRPVQQRGQCLQRPYGPVVSPAASMSRSSTASPTRPASSATRPPTSTDAAEPLTASGATTVDEAADNKVLTFPNVIVLYANIHTYPGHEKTDLQYVEYAWAASATTATAASARRFIGRRVPRWKATAPVLPERGRHLRSTRLEISTGKSYVAVTRHRLCRELPTPRWTMSI